MGDDEVDELRDELVRSRLAHKEPDVLKRIGSPGKQDQKTDENGTNGVQVPHNFAAHD